MTNPPTLLVIDDEAVARYVLRKLLRDIPYLIAEAADGSEGLRRAHELQPRLILLDLNMPGLTGEKLLEQLKADPLTRAIPVVIVTALVLTESDRQRLATHTYAILSKDSLSRDRLKQVISDADAPP
jgi:CheY-like chemotaxis protein